jgi:hypothetical protein
VTEQTQPAPAALRYITVASVVVVGLIAAEMWLPVVGWETGYEVSSYGRVRSITRQIVHKNGRTHTYQGKILQPTIHPKGGYLLYNLTQPRRTVTGHVLFMRTFVGLPLPGVEVRHLDGNLSNNHWTNLAYGTRLDNMADQRKHGTHGNTVKIKCPFDHLLVAPNLMPYFVAKNQRNCLACGRARSAIGYAKRSGKPIPDMQTLADAKYRLIMEAA